MDSSQAGPDAQATLRELLGYLNFAAGAPDARFRSAFTRLAVPLSEDTGPNEAPWQRIPKLLKAELAVLHRDAAAFKEVEQAESVIRLVFDELLAAYRNWHQELLFHHSDESLFRPFFLARACEAVLRQGSPWDEDERIIAGALSDLNDFIGHRPVASLRSPQQIEPYAHEWVCPIPLFWRGVGVDEGPYRAIVEQAMAILAAADKSVLDRAGFELNLLDELALDPRAYDFDHPVNKRPNYQFGQWDPHKIDNQGRYRRMVLVGITLDVLVERTHGDVGIAPGEALYEAGAVLAGTMLMASGTSGRGPAAHDSGTTLANLVPRIATYRDLFYDRLLKDLPGSHGERLRAEAATVRQPFGGARRHLNQRLARLRAAQLAHVHLAQLFARMGYPEASAREAQVVPVASARILCEIDGRITGGHFALDHAQLDNAVRLLGEIDGLIHRGIECGALVDPWNILGFQGQFSLFPALENSVRDHRVDVLVRLIEQAFGLYARVQGEAAARGDARSAAAAAAGLAAQAQWWDRFATLEVEGVQHVWGHEARESSDRVSAALGAWHRAGAAAGDIGFWRQHVAHFNSAKAYYLVIEALLEKRDFVAAMALLVQWLSRSDEASLDDGSYSFHQLTLSWLTELLADSEPESLRRSPQESTPAPAGSPAAPPGGRTSGVADPWSLVRKFFDYLEANAEAYWEVPEFELPGGRPPPRGAAPDSALSNEPPDDASDEDQGDDKSLFRAAYDEMSYRDSTADGEDADVLQGGPPTDFELDGEGYRISTRLLFLANLARLWKLAAARAPRPSGPRADRVLAIESWFRQALVNRRGLLELAQEVHRYPLQAPSGAYESLVEYSRRRSKKDALLDRIVDACVETSDAARVLRAVCRTPHAEGDLATWEERAVAVLEALFQGQTAPLRAAMPSLIEALKLEPILYVPLSRGGAPGPLIGAATLKRLLETLLRGLPRSGLVKEACQLLSTIPLMERQRPSGEGVVTEFDRLFKIGFRAIVEAVVAAAASEADAPPVDDVELADTLRGVTESLLKLWLDHSRSLRLSVLERVANPERWQALRQFVERYGRDLFVPRFMNLDNLRAILQQGVAMWLERLEQDPDASSDQPMLADLDGKLNRAEAIDHLSIAIEAVVENYTEFKDFNSTTTQSDRGELLYILLDLLRVKAAYDRFAWQIRPFVLVHDVLVRAGRPGTAEVWRRALAERTSDVADWHQQTLAERSREYGVHLPTVADRLSERFVRPLAVDRLRALVRPALDEASRGGGSESFQALDAQLREFTENPTGVGLDVPTWLLALEHEVELAHPLERRIGSAALDEACLPLVRLSWGDVQEQIQSAEEQQDV